MSAQVLKNNCTSGELTPLLHDRTDIQQYQNGLALCFNAIVSPYGGVYRRPGTVFIAAAKYSNKLCVLRKFEFSIDQAYVLEFGDLYVRIFMNGGQIIDAGAPVEIASPYTEDILRSLRFEQSADVLYIFHVDHFPMKQTRTSHIAWTLDYCDFRGGPFLDDNDTAVTLQASAVTGSGITVTASSAIFKSGHIGSLWKLTSGKMVQEVIASISSNTSTSSVKTASEVVEVEISGTWNAVITVERSFNNGTNWYAYQTISANCVKQYSDTRDILYRITVSGYVSGAVGARLSVLDAEENGQGTFRITAVAENGLSCTATVIDRIRSIDPTKIWAEAAWSGVRGFPRAGKIYDGRLVMFGTRDDPTGVWGSSAFDFEDMKRGSNDDEAFYFSLDAKGGVNVVKWVESWKHLAVGTFGGELRLTHTNPITPSNPPDKKRDTDYGSADIQGFVAHKAVLFVDRSGRILREYAYDYNTDVYDAQSISILAEHIPNDGNGIVDIAYQQKQDSIIWAVLANGDIGALTYLPYQGVSGWHRHSLANYGEAESVCVIPGSEGEDELWLSVKRMIAGSEVRYIEAIYNSVGEGYFAIPVYYDWILRGQIYNTGSGDGDITLYALFKSTITIQVTTEEDADYYITTNGINAVLDENYVLRFLLIKSAHKSISPYTDKVDLISCKQGVSFSSVITSVPIGSYGTVNDLITTSRIIVDVAKRLLVFSVKSEDTGHLNGIYTASYTPVNASDYTTKAINFSGSFGVPSKVISDYVGDLCVSIDPVASGSGGTGGLIFSLKYLYDSGHFLILEKLSADLSSKTEWGRFSVASASVKYSLCIDDDGGLWVSIDNKLYCWKVGV